MSIFLVFLLSVFSGIGLFWIFKYKAKIKLFYYPSFYLKSLMILILSNTVFIVYSFVQTFLWVSIVKNNPTYEPIEGSLGGAFVEKGIAQNYNTFSSLILIITILVFVLLFIKGFIDRKKSKSLIPQQSPENKPLVLLKIGLSFLLFIMVIFSLIMLVLTSDFTVSYLE
jgi:hypothetical protein